MDIRTKSDRGDGDVRRHCSRVELRAQNDKEAERLAVFARILMSGICLEEAAIRFAQVVVDKEPLLLAEAAELLHAAGVA